MALGEQLMLLRKKKGLSQSALGKVIGTSGDVVGRYERGLMAPSIEAIIKLADALEVSIDYLVGKADIELDKETFDRLKEVSKLPQEDKHYIFRMVDALIRDAKARQAYS
ncbi:MAG: transcriptional regulator [Cytophagales bacterium CG12_big_fil_rev_8_21_14_0_65_40_12]|nr:MAG: transcriptional regulator [Cytophagales bacterium CG12_big_fil_rev_8_21_14_0_65_40_12]